MPYKAFEKIIKEIKTVQESEALIATVIITFVSIDTMAYLSMPAEQAKNNSKDFINWVNKYMRTEDSQSYQYIPNEMWAARCGKLHSYSSYSDIATKKGYKLYGYHDGANHIYNPQESTRLVLISVPRLVNDFIHGVKNYLQDTSKDKKLKQLLDSRITKINQQYDISESNKKNV